MEDWLAEVASGAEVPADWPRSLLGARCLLARGAGSAGLSPVLLGDAVYADQPQQAEYRQHQRNEAVADAEA